MVVDIEAPLLTIFCNNGSINGLLAVLFFVVFGDKRGNGVYDVIGKTGTTENLLNLAVKLSGSICGFSPRCRIFGYYWSDNFIHISIVAVSIAEFFFYIIGKWMRSIKFSNNGCSLVDDRLRISSFAEGTLYLSIKLNFL